MVVIRCQRTKRMDVAVSGHHRHPARLALDQVLFVEGEARCLLFAQRERIVCARRALCSVCCERRAILGLGLGSRLCLPACALAASVFCAPGRLLFPLLVVLVRLGAPLVAASLGVSLVASLVAAFLDLLVTLTSPLQFCPWRHHNRLRNRPLFLAVWSRGFCVFCG